MKKTLFSLIAVMIVTFSIAVADGDKVVKIKTTAVCEMCKARIERTLGLSKGVKESNLDLKDKVVTVKYNPGKTTEEAIRATIINTGYDADGQLANQKAHDKLPSCCKKTVAVYFARFYFYRVTDFYHACNIKPCKLMTDLVKDKKGKKPNQY